MRVLSVEQQIALLSRGRSFAGRMHWWFIAGAAACATAAAVFWHPVPLVVAIFLAVIGFSERRAGPNIVAALAAYESGRPTAGDVDIEITHWDGSDSCRATVREFGQPAWEYQFVPQGWTPVSGTRSASIWRAHAGGPPVMASVAEGLMIPREVPKQRG
jgi:hypothetical protein